MAGKFYAIKEGFDSSNNIKVENKIEEGNTMTKENDEQLKKALEEVLKK